MLKMVLPAENATVAPAPRANVRISISAFISFDSIRTRGHELHAPTAMLRKD
jgi:hypothetical protein